MRRFSTAAGALVMTLVGLSLAAVPCAAADDDQEASGRGYLGVTLQDLSASMAKALQLGDRDGVLVNEVIPDSPAEKAGVQAGDVILQFDGEPTPDASSLTKAVRLADPGDKAAILVLREGREKSLQAELGEHAGLGKDATIDLEQDEHAKILQWMDQDGKKLKILPEGDRDVRIIMREFGDRGYLGVGMQELTEQLGDYFKVEGGKGVLVSEVAKDSPAQAAGLKAGDVIVRIDDLDIASPADLHEAMAEAEPGQEVALTVLRQGKRQQFKATLAETPEGAPHAGMPMMWRHMSKDAPMPPQAMPHWSPDRDVEIRRLGRDDEALQELREQMDQIKEQLDELRKEFQQK